MHILIVKFQSGLSHDEVVRNLQARLPLFRAVPGLIQKYYARETSTGDYVGIYPFESEQALRDYRVSEVARGIPGVYQVQGTPRIEELEMLFPLRPEIMPARL
jgi:hypothetical protein